MHYTTNMAASRLKLSLWSEPFAVALGDLLLDIPFDILGIKLLWWTWHDTDPNIFDRSYNVPLTRWAGGGRGGRGGIAIGSYPYLI